MKSPAHYVASIVAVAAMIGSQPAAAALVNSLPDGAKLSFAGAFQSTRLDDGRFMRDYDGFSFAAAPLTTTTNQFVSTSRPSIDFGGNNVWSGPLMHISCCGGLGQFEFEFDDTQSGVVFEMNWNRTITFLPNFQIAAFDSRGRLLESATIFYQGNTGTFGFGQRSSADIKKLTISGAGFGVRNMMVTDVISAVPEPATWSAMVLGFGLIGGALRAPKRHRPLAA